VSYRDNGLSKAYKVDDEHKWGYTVDLRIGNELDGEKILGEDYKGYVLRISGGSDQEGFPMKNGVLRKGRARLLIPPRTCGLRRGRDGERKRRSVRGAIVDRDVGCLHFTIVSKGAKEIEGLTNVKTPRRLGPKRANKIRKLFGLPKHSDNIGKKGKSKINVDRFDVTRYVVKRPMKVKGDKSYYKAPKIQRLITSQRLRRKRDARKDKLKKVEESNTEYKAYVDKLKALAADRKKKVDTTQTGAPAQTGAPKTAAPAKTATTGKTATPAKPTTAAPAKTAAPATQPKTTAAPAKPTTAAPTKAAAPAKPIPASQAKKAGSK
jgi:small subunit ribosomal protein S6e